MFTPMIDVGLAPVLSTWDILGFIYMKCFCFRNQRKLSRRFLPRVSIVPKAHDVKVSYSLYFISMTSSCILAKDTAIYQEVN